MKKRGFIPGIILASLLLVSCQGDKDEKVNEPDPIEFRKDGELLLIKTEGDTIQELDIEIADDTFERETGLMHRRTMADHQGMLFIFEDEALRAFYMKNTYIPLDLIYFASDSTAVSFHENAEPRDETALPSGEPAQFVLEINAGLTEEWGLEVGDKISFTRSDID